MLWLLRIPHGLVLSTVSVSCLSDALPSASSCHASSVPSSAGAGRNTHCRLYKNQSRERLYSFFLLFRILPPRLLRLCFSYRGGVDTFDWKSSNDSRCCHSPVRLSHQHRLLWMREAFAVSLQQGFFQERLPGAGSQ